MSALVHHEVSLDKAAPKQKFQYHFCGKFSRQFLGPVFLAVFSYIKEKMVVEED